jgi:hypothetical protein
MARVDPCRRASPAAKGVSAFSRNDDELSVDLRPDRESSHEEP